MTSLALSKATNYYNTGCFGNAVEELKTAAAVECQSDKDQNRRAQRISHQSQNGIFAALPKLAVSADISLCEFRSSLNSSSPQDIFEQLTRAREANETYMNALEGTLCSLWLTLGNRVDGEKDPNERGRFCIDKERLQISMAILMTSVSGSWLHLHFNGENKYEKEPSKAAGQLRRGIALAACSFVCQNPKQFRPVYTESFEILNTVLARAKSDPSFRTEAERMSTALRSFHHASKLLTLQSRQGIGACSDVEEINRVSGTRKRTRQIDSMLSTKRSKGGKDGENNNNSTSDVSYNQTQEQGRNNGDQDYSKLALQEHLISTLHHHQKIQESVNHPSSTSCMRASRLERDKSLQHALSIEKGGFTGKLYRFLAAIDFLNEKEIKHHDPCDETKNTKEIIQSLKAISSTSKTAASLLGCVQAKIGNYQNALSSFETALKLQKYEGEERDLSQYQGVISNIAQCFGMLGQPDNAVEVLLYWINHFNDKKRSDNSGNKDVSTDNITVSPLSVELNGMRQMQPLGVQTLSVLYRLYFASTLTGDWDTCYNAIDGIKQVSKETSLTELMEAFVAFQCGDYSHRVLKAHANVSKASIEDIGVSMYRFQAGARLFLENANTSASTDEHSDTENDCSINTESLDKHIIESQSLWKKLSSKLPALPTASGSDYNPLHMIEICHWNNQGIYSVMKDRKVEAMSHFFKAIQLSRDTVANPIAAAKDDTPKTESPNLKHKYSLLPIFNLSLVLWRGGPGSQLEACKLYLPERGYKESLQTALKGQPERLSLDLDASIAAYNKAESDTRTEVKSNTGGGNSNSMTFSSAGKDEENPLQLQFLAFEICLMRHILKRRA